MYDLIYGVAAKANLHRHGCTCEGRTHVRLARVPDAAPVDATTLVAAMQHPTVTRAKSAGYRVIVSKCARHT